MSIAQAWMREVRMKCQQCGYERVPAGARWCPNCSQRLYLMAGVDYTELVTERTQGFTGREWVFRAIDAWLDDPQGARVFLLTGGPGTGKTAIAAQLVRMAEGDVPAEPYPHLNAGSLRFFQFCQAFHNDTLDPLRFTKHLSLNLASVFPPFADALTQVGVRDPEIHIHQDVGTVATGGTVAGILGPELNLGNLSARVAFDRVVAGPLKQIAQADAPGTILILLDALDEALTYPGETLVDLLAHAMDDPHDLPDQVRFLLTSRPDERVTHPLGQPALDLIANAPADVDDVRAYAYRRLRALHEPRRSDLAGRIADASQGNFLYSRYVIDDLPADLERIEDPAELPLPEDLPDVYRQFLRRELGRSLDTWDEDYAPLLGALAVARGDGLTSSQLAGVTKQGRTKMRRLLRTCGQYLAGPQPDGPFRIYHQSFRGFLLEDSKYRVFPQESNQDIADFYLKTWNKDRECDTYGLRHLPIHMVEVGYNDELRELLLDFDWLQAKLAATDVRALIADLELLPADADVGLVEEALRLSAHVLARDKAQLWGQLYGRLMGEASPAIQEMLEEWPEGLWLRPLRPSLTAPGGPLLRTLTGHSNAVAAVAVYDGGRRAISGSWDHTLKVWNLERGQVVRTLEGHTFSVEAVAVYDEGRRAISASSDNTLKVWDLESGQELSTLEGHTGWVNAVAVYDGGRRAISASGDHTLKVWDLSKAGLERGQDLRTLEGHSREVTAVAVYDGGRRAISASSDNTLKVWDLESGQELRTLKGHTHWVDAVAVYDGGRRAISASADGTLKVWDLENGTALVTYSGDGSFQTCAVTPDDRTVVAGDARGRVHILRLEGGEK